MVGRRRLNGNGHAHEEDEHDFQPRRRLPDTTYGRGNRNWAGDGSIRNERIRGAPAPGLPTDQGRPTSFREEYVEQARKLAELGHTDAEMAKFFGIGYETFRNWRSRWPQLSKALIVGKEVADNRVERSLYQKAVGFHVAAEKVFCSEGAIVRAKITQYYPPDTGAAIFWLKNRRGWTDRAQIEFTPGPESSFAEQLRERLDRLEVPKEVNLGPGDFKRVD